MSLSPLMLVRQHFPDRHIHDIPGTISAELAGAGLTAKLAPGSKVAIGVGSRGISNIAQIVRAVVDFCRAQGLQPFLFPAMGSHGAATAAGQADVLAHYGITEASMGVPVISSLHVESLGETPEGIEVFMDSQAFHADGVLLVGRVKWHTDFAGKLESGLYKMMAIGLGKFAGAQQYHSFAYKLGLEAVIRAAGGRVLATGKILGGLAILEDAYHQTAQLTAVPVAGMEQREEELLALAKSWMARIPVAALDLLVINEIGKNISGAGMDTKVVNRSVNGQYNPWPNAPVIERLFLRDLSSMSYGNGVGLGMADVIHDRLLEKIDWTPTYINSLTASTPAAIQVPIHFSTDRECIDRIARTVGKLDLSTVTAAWIQNSLELGMLAVTENLRSEIVQNPHLEIVEDGLAWPYDESGNLHNPLQAAQAISH